MWLKVMSRFRKAAPYSFLLICILVLAPFLAFAQLRVSPDSLYLTEQNGTPVLLNGESAWCLFTAITYTDANTFLANCQSKGVNYLQTMLIEDGFTLNAPANAYGVTPFTGATFSTPRESYFLHCDSVINLAASYGIYVMLYPAYLGSNPSEGWQTEISAASAATMKTYGRYVGARYRNFPNIVWSIGGDIQPSPWQVKCDSMAAGIRFEDPTNLMSTRDDPETFAHTNWPNRYWLTLNGFYPYWGPAEYLPERIYQMGKQSRSYSPRQPFVLQEAYYEGEGATQLQLRQQSYYGILGGAIAGQVYGNCPIWHFSQRPSSLCGAGNWFNELGSQGHINNKWVGKLFRSRYWYKLIPDTNQVVMTAGYGTNGNGTYVTTSFASDSSSIIAYLPTPRTVTINPNRLTGDSVHVYWFNPSNGVVTDAGMYSKITRAYGQPGGGDWVMVMDSKTFAGTFDVPGGNPPSTPTVPAPPALAAPPNGATGVATSPTLTWNASVGATTYRLQVSTNAGFTTTVADQGSITATSFGVTGLAYSTTYYWHVNATNSAGTSAYSTTRNFTTVGLSPPSSPPLLNNPHDGATGVSTSPMMEWGSTAGATMYRLQLATDSTFAATVVDDSTIADTSRLLTGLPNSTHYYWRVNGRNSAGSSPWSQVFRFTTAPTTSTFAVGAGWNMVSVPLTVDDGRRTFLFPTSTSEAFAYTGAGGYVQRDTLMNREGYWLKFNAAQNVSVSGLVRTQDTIQVNFGWNILGSISTSVEIDSIVQIPGGIISSDYFTYDTGYTRSFSVDPGKGYWVKASASGMLILHGSAPRIKE